MAEEIEIKFKLDGKPIKEFKKELAETKKAMDAATDPSEMQKLMTVYKNGSKQLANYNKSLRATAEATNEVTNSNRDLNATFEDVYGDLKPLSSRLGELEDRMYELALAGESNTEEFESMRTEAARMRQSIIEVDKQVDVLAENKGLSAFGGGLEEVGSSLMRLDFDTAAKQASALATASGKISFGSAISSIKQLGSTFINLGKALLVNPLFLIAAVIAAIVVAVIALLDKLGFLKGIMEAIGAAIEWVVQQFKNLLDWLGLTNYAEQDAAEKSAQAAEKKAAAYEEANQRMEQALDHEIRMAELAGESTIGLERKKIESSKESNKAQLDASKARYEAEKLKGQMDDEELAALAKQVRDKRAQYKQSLMDIEYFNAQEAQARKQFALNMIEATKEAQSIIKADQEKAYGEFLAARDRRIAAEREIQDAQLELMKEGTERELKEIEIRYNRLIEDTRNNEALIQSEKLKLIELYGEQRKQAEAVVEDAITAELEAKRASRIERLKEKEAQVAQTKEEKIAAAAEIESLLFDLQEDSFDKSIEALRQAEKEKAAIVQKAYDDGLISHEASEAAKTEIKKSYDAQRTALDEARAKADRDRNKAVADGALDLANGVLAGVAANLKEGGDAAKAVAVAMATIETYKAAVAAFASTQMSPISVVFPAAPYIAAASAVAMGIANVRKILAVDTSGKGSGSTPSASAAQAPSFGTPQQTPQTPTMNLNDGVNQNAGGSVKREKVMVVDYTDINDKGKELAKIDEKFTLA